MSKTHGRTRLLYTVLTAAAVGCSSPDNRTNHPPSGHVEATSRQALTTANGYAQNGLWANGLWANGLWANGLWANGLWANGLWANGLWANGLWANGLWANGLWANGLWANGLWANGLWANGLSGDAAIPGETLRNSEYARALLQYIYACAMPAVTYDTAIDPGAGSCTPGGDATLECGGAGYGCSPAGACVVPLTGSIGIGVNADGTTWGESGTCDESCQRWVSACVLARTNAYGVHVEISMRAPTVIPPGREAQFAKIQAALATSPAEVTDFSMPEGAYFGNLFATTPVNPPPASGNGPTDGPIATTPVFYACAGPASNIPDLTKRFCSSQGDATVISVPGVCITGTTTSGVTEAGTCNGTDATQPKHDCYTTPSAAPRPDCTNPHDPTCYQEVISVFLKMPVAVCKNNICETGETEASCPWDCHPGTWAHSYDKPLSEQNFTGSPTTVTAVGNPDQSIVMAGLALQPVDFGKGDLVGDGSLGLVKFNADGTYVWGRRELPALSPSVTHAVAVGGDGSIVVSGLTTIPPALSRIWLGKFDANGDAAPNWPIIINGEQGITNGTRLAIDREGNILVSASAPGGALPNSNYAYGDAYVYKVSTGGQVLWAAGLGPSYGGYVNPIAADANGDVLVTILSPNTDGVPTNVRLLKLASATGAIVWDSRITNARAGAAADAGMFCALVVDAAGDTYVMNSAFNNALDSGLEKFAAADGLRLFADAMSIYHPGAVCYAGHDFLSLAPDGSVVAGIVFGGSFRTIADLGAGEFDSYSTADVAIGSYAPDTTLAPGTPRFRWAKHMPMILQSQFNGMGVDSAGRVVVTGSYSGSMLVDGRLLINNLPALTGNANAYLASFGPPSQTDTSAPIIGIVIDADGSTINTVPTHIYTPATSSKGAVVFYMPPTAADEGYAGANVSCTPRPNTMFPIGTTTVTCTATDPLGNHAAVTFPVTVFDSYGPAFAPVTNPPPVQAPTSAGATVTFPTPTATDQIDGARPVTCSPPSGSVFAVGDTTVTCSATDLSNHTSRTTLKVTVTPPLLGSGCSSSADCASGSCVDGVCCNTSSCGACHACNVPGSVGTCAPTSGGSCSDGNACTGGDVCRVGVCVAGPPVTCDDGNVCTVDSCKPSTGCAHVPGNAGVVCRPAANICDTAETCSGQTAICPASTDARPPRLGAGSNQTVVGTCSSAPIAFTVPAVTNASCETGTTVACTKVAGNSYGAHLVTCTARDAAGNVSPPVTFTVTVLRPLSVRVQPPLTGNGGTTVVKRNSTVYNKVLLFACDTNVTESAPVTVKLGVKFFRGNGTPGTPVSVNCDGVGDAGGVMKLESKMYRYDLSTKGFNITNSDPSYYEEAITVTYRSAPGVTVGSDTVRLEVK